MAEQMSTTFSQEEIGQQAQENANALTLVTIAYLTSKNLDVDEYAEYVGSKFAPGWAEMQGMPASALARVAALNMVSVGATLKSLSGDDTKASAVISGWPSEEGRSYFGVENAQADATLRIFGPIAENLGFAFEMSRRGDEVTMKFTKS